VFALGARGAAGVGYAARPYARELQQLRDQAAFGRLVEQRALSMSAAERRRFDILMRWPAVCESRTQVRLESLPALAYISRTEWTNVGSWRVL
jgi:hypothetical protein